MTNITCDGIRLGDNIENIAFDNYNLSNRFPDKKNTVNFEEWKITTDTDNIINRIHANFISIEVSINSKIDSEIIDDIIAILGNNHSTGWYDREQGLKQAVYIDYDNHIKATLVYSNYNNDLVWIIMEIVD